MSIEIEEWGIDVAYPQGDRVDWQAVEKVEGCSFGICQVDSTYDRNAREIRDKTAISLGAYLVLNPAADPVAQARTLVRRAGNMRPSDLGFAIDFEVTRGVLGLPLLRSLVLCAREVLRISGRLPLIYCGRYFWAEAITQHAVTINDRESAASLENEIARYPLWHAAYPRMARNSDWGSIVRSLPDDPSIAAPWARLNKKEDAWQFDGDGGLRLPSGLDVDVSRWRGSIAAFVARTTAINPLEPLLWPDVWAVQSALLKLGFHLGNSGPKHDGVDGDAGSQTIGAVKAFQNEIGVEANGTIDAELGRRLLDALQSRGVA